MRDNNLANTATDEILDALIWSVSNPLETWVLDYGASFHLCNKNDVMEHYTSGDFVKFYLTDDEPFEIIEKGGVRIKAPNGIVLQLRDVRHIPG